MDIEAIKKTIEELEKTRVQQNIQRETIEFIVASIDFFDEKKVLEIGTFNGYSALWFATVADEVVTVEAAEEAFNEAKKNLEFAKNVGIVFGNVFDVIAKLKEEGRKFNIVFIDGKKSEYADYLESVLDVLDDNFMIFADNTISHKDMIGGFFENLKRHDDILEWKEMNIGKGLVVIKKKF